jgi:acyl-coenzyme A thioesterase PaaI-like protein
MPIPIPRQFGFTTCFVCGPDNPRGLHLVFQRDGDRVVTTFTAPAEYGGYGAILHGGLTSTLLDEAMCWAAYGLLGELSMTTDLRVKFLGLIRCGEPLTITGWISSRDALGAEARAEVRDAAGISRADAVAALRFVSARAAEKLSR